MKIKNENIGLLLYQVKSMIDCPYAGSSYESNTKTITKTVEDEDGEITSVTEEIEKTKAELIADKKKLIEELDDSYKKNHAAIEMMQTVIKMLVTELDDKTKKKLSGESYY